MFDKLKDVKIRYELITKKLVDPEVISRQDEFQKIAKEHSDMKAVVEKYDEYMAVKKSVDEAVAILKESSDPDLKELAQMELEEGKDQLEEMEQALKVLLLKKDPYDDRNIYLEIRAGAGGDEASLFAVDVYRMYTRYAEIKGWKTEVMSCSETGVGGYKEMIVLIKGHGAYSRLKFESGGHRVQRIPETESGGRIHTSAITVAVLPEVAEVDVHINPSDLRIDTYRSSGAGGQHVNTTDSAVRITHIPSGVVVAVQDERSQIKNREKAMKLILSRVAEMEIAKQESEIAQDRKLQVGSGDRSERIRTYNYPQNRVSDHRIKENANLDKFMEGYLDDMLDAIAAFDQAERLKASGL